MHLMARTPFKPGKFIRNWSFNDEEVPEVDPEYLNEVRRKIRRRSTSPGRTTGSSQGSSAEENVIANEGATSSSVTMVI